MKTRLNPLESSRQPSAEAVNLPASPANRRGIPVESIHYQELTPLRTDPFTFTLICPQCQHPMRVVAVIDQRQVVEKILRHLGLWNGGQTLAPARAPPDAETGPWTREPCDDVDPMPNYENVLTD